MFLATEPPVRSRRIWPRRRVTTVGLAFLVHSGVGALPVGVAPANDNLAVHTVEALLNMLGALVLLITKSLDRVK